MDEDEEKELEWFLNAQRQYKIDANLPENALLLSDAFLKFFNASFPILDQLEMKMEVAENTGQKDQYDEAVAIWEIYQREASRAFRDALVEGELSAHINDPQCGVEINLKTDGWKLRGEDTVATDFLSDFSSNPNRADATISGVSRPIYFHRDVFDLWLRKQFKVTSVGRPKGSGSFQKSDLILYYEMEKLLQSGVAKSDFEAARIVANKALGASEISKTFRLFRGFRRWLASRSR